jgi:putative oxidoreductase
MKGHLVVSARLLRPLILLLNALRDVGDLVARLWVSKIFLASAMSKVVAWGSTIVLFKYDYSVPFLPPVVAAYIGTAAEFILPVLLILGLGGRIAIFAFFVYNIICVLSFHFLWTPVGLTGLDDHINWGILLMLLMFHGAGRLSLDYWLHKRYGHLIYQGKQTHWVGK